MNGQGYRGNGHFFRAIQKYGWESFDHRVIEVDDKSQMNYLEKYLIKFYDTTNPDKGYNLDNGGNGHGVHSEQSRKKNSLAHMGVSKGPHKQETRQKMSETAKQRPRLAWKTPEGKVRYMTIQAVYRNHPDWISINKN